MILLLLHGLLLLLFTYLLCSICYLFLVAVGGRIWRSPKYPLHVQKEKIAILIPSYKEDHIILDTARQAKAHDYPCFEVFVIADRLQPETIETLRSIPVNVLKVDFEIGMKSKSLHEVLNSIPEDQFDLAMILDADNIMEAGCLEKINSAFQHGCGAVQCHRVAKNKNNAVSLLDAISEEINNNLFRSGQRAMGFSASLIGSGMAFPFMKLKQIMNEEHILSNPGEDREIELQLIKDSVVIQYLDDAMVYDEKVASAAVFERQRTRWLEAQLTHIKRMFDKDLKSISGTKEYWNKLFQVLLLPRSLYLVLLGFLTILFACAYFFQIPLFYPAPVWWLLLAILYLFSLILSVPSAFYNAKTLSALAKVPVLMLSMVRALLKMKSNRKEFLHTPKIHTTE